MLTNIANFRKYAPLISTNCGADRCFRKIAVVLLIAVFLLTLLIALLGTFLGTCRKVLFIVASEIV